MTDESAIIEFIEGEKHCTILCKGSFREGLFITLVERINGHRASAPDTKRYLVDLRGTQYAIDGFARYRIAEYAAGHLSGLRIAVVGNAGVVDKLTENTGNNRGLPLLVTSDEAEAMQWLDNR